MLFEDYLRELADLSPPLRISRLAPLSHLAGEQREAFLAAWPSIDVERRRQVVRQLVELAEDSVDLNFNAVFGGCLDDEDAQVRRQAIGGLWEYEGCDLIPPLLRILEQDEDAEVRAAAALALGRFVLLYEHGKLRPRYFEPVEAALRSILTHPGQPEAVRARALEAIAPCSSLSWVPRAIREAYEKGTHRLRISAFHAMGRRDASWLPVLLQELASQDPEVRYEVAVACGSIGDERAVPYLAPLLYDQDDQVQMAAIAALGEIGGTEAKTLLLSLARDAALAVQDAVRDALSEIDVGETMFSFWPRL